MKRLRKVSTGWSSSTTRGARVTEHLYGAKDKELLTTQKSKFVSLSEEEDDDDDAVAEEEEEEEEEEDEAGYGLRQNHRKTWRISSIKNGANHHREQQHQQKFVCSKCEKAFQSLKAMCGHMACHSEKEKPSSNVAAKLKLVMDSRSDTESGAQQLRRGTRRTRYKKHNSVAVSKAKVDVPNNCSSEASGVEQEQEEVAICLMMLSRDPSNWAGLNSIGDSSDNNSIVLEARSISTNLAQKDGSSFGYHVDEAMEKCGTRKVGALGDSESGYVRNGAKNVEKIENLRKNKLDEESRTEAHLSLEKIKSMMVAGLNYDLCRDGEGFSQIERLKMDSYLRKSTLDESHSAGYNVGNHYSNAEMHPSFEYKALLHSQSHQPFNSNIANHTSFTATAPYESGENSFETDASPDIHKGKGVLEHNSGNVDDKWKKGKHECPVCSKVFRSGQALGSHSRVHLAEGSDGIMCDEVAVNSKADGIRLHELIDLNQPAPTEDDEASESMGSYCRLQALHQA